VLSKRRLTQLVRDGHVAGWDDPRMPTLAGLRRRGFPAAAVRDFARRLGVTKSDSVVEMSFLEHCAREVLNKTAPRRMAVLRPLKVVIENFPEGRTEQLDAVNNPEDASAGSRKVPFSREIFIESDDFMEDPPKKFFRLAPGREVRLRYAYFITCTGVVKDSAGKAVELRCTYDPGTRGGNAPDGRKVKATMHWVSANDALTAEVRLYDHLFAAPDPGATQDIDPGSLEILAGCRLEPALGVAKAGEAVQFERLGYFTPDLESRPPGSQHGGFVFNRTVGLRDTWAKVRDRD
jgi:glutaminyl-tRNA synthetase